MTFTTRPELRGTHGMVASTHWLASGAGMAMLERGGNAFDAAVAAGFVLQVVEPHLNGPGGEVPIVLYSAERDDVVVICGQGPAPAAARPERFAELGLDLIPGNGLLAACVPGAVDAWLLMLRDFGTFGLAEVLEPAIGYAERGYPLVPGIRVAIADIEPLLREHWTSSAEVYLPGGELPRAGELFRNPDLAGTYRRLVAASEGAGGLRESGIDAARGAFYRGAIAETLASWLESAEAMDGTGRRHGALMDGDDLARFEATFEAPVTLDYHGHTVCKTGPWGQGPVMLQQLALLAGFDLEAIGPGPEYVHTVVECAKLAFADRDAWYGDPGFTDVPLEALLSAAYADERRALVCDRASTELRPGSPGGAEPRMPPLVKAVPGAAASGEPTLALAREDRGATCHLDVADRHGNLVSATPSGGWLQSSPVIPGLGFCLGTRMQMFWLTAGLPSTLAPGKRPRTTLTPTLVLRDGAPYMALGTPGGDMQDQWSLGVLLGHLHFGLDLQAAIDAPSFHSNHGPSSFHPRALHLNEIEIEERAGEATIAELRQRGHDVEVTEPWSLGRVSAVARERGGVLKAGANARGMQGYAVGR
ncbi:MAG: gamma-glutamyltransferase family protein [Solirubrobacteraceae bacterium]